MRIAFLSFAIFFAVMAIQQFQSIQRKKKIKELGRKIEMLKVEIKNHAK